MNPKEFLAELDDARVLTAIAQAEAQTSGEVRLYISNRKISDALTAARERFLKLGMHKTRERNGVLIYLAPRTRVFAIVGDAGIHARCGDGFWQEASARFTQDLHSKPLTDAMVELIGAMGSLLAREFPRQEDDRNELPDRIERD